MANTATKRILVVDDESTVLFILSSALRTLGEHIEVVTASNGYEALEQVAQDNLSLLITDIQMPGINGVELTRQVLTLSPQVRVIWITAYGSECVRKEGERLGVCECLDKPLKIDAIRQAALRAIASRDC